MACGLLLLCTESANYCALLAAPGEGLFEELAKIIGTDKREIPAVRLGVLVQKLCGALCDPAPDATAFLLAGFPRCSICGGEVSTRRMLNVYTEKDLQSPTHAKWDGLSEPQRLHAVREALCHT
jgi:hypothetical protein